ncbi:hypothetical protein [Nocardia jinanensis]|uniref:Uncharacterized protein n=1 Tax=Nocardia jinanensis TaxID=382504 RepID=A0A917RXX0_9NOCA|nr:hypothetical protein [Nocardia jinanensis]GGL42933.1 hypothetical protein GCM10011588_67120 [Nocardia jinanensis]
MRVWGQRGSSTPRTAARWGRRLLWCLAGLFVLTVLPGALGAVAVAQDGATGQSRIDGVAWMNVRDSFGVALADYTYISDKGGLFDPGATVVWTIVGLEFVGYMVIVTSAIWFIGFVLSFAWLDFFANALRGTAGAFADQLATPSVLITAATIGAFFVAWFIVRGFHARAVIQTVTMLAVAVLGPLFLADPLATALGSDGLLARGRDVGLAVATGLNGSTNRNPDLAVSTLQGDMADNFARRPVQVWNFGHVVDNQSTCAAAWSSGVTSGDTDRTQRALHACGDTAAAAAAAHPSVGQIGTGLLLLVSAALLLLFAVVLSYRLMRAALDAVMQGFLAIFGFAAGGFVFGPTQTFLIRNLVNSGIAAARLCAYTVFVGVYLLFLGNLFQQARGQVLAVIVIAAVVETVAILQFGRLSKGLTRGSDWMANRFSLTIQGARGGSGGTALGMGGGGKSSGGGSGMGAVASLAALNTVNASPLTAWMAGRTVNPLSPLAFGKMRNDRVNVATADSRLEGHQWKALARQNWRLLARREGDEWGGIDTELGLARALKYLDNNRVPYQHMSAVLLDAGASHSSINQALRARSARNETRSRNPYGFAPLQKAVASGNGVINHAGTDAQAAFAAQAVADADSLARHTLAPDPGAQLDSGFIARVEQHWDSDRALRANISPDEWNSVGRATRTAIAHRLATDHYTIARAFSDNPTSANRDSLMASVKRLANLDHTVPESGLDPWDV